MSNEKWGMMNEVFFCQFKNSCQESSLYLMLECLYWNKWLKSKLSRLYRVRCSSQTLFLINRFFFYMYVLTVLFLIWNIPLNYFIVGLTAMRINLILFFSARSKSNLLCFYFVIISCRKFSILLTYHKNHEVKSLVTSPNATTCINTSETIKNHRI